MVVQGKNNPIAMAFINSIERVAKAEPQWALPLPVAVVRTELGRFTGHTDLEIPVEEVTNLQNAIRHKDINTVRKILGEIAKLPTSLHKKANLNEVEERIAHMCDFLEWHAKTLPKDYLPGHEVSLRRLASVSVILRKPELSPFVVKMALKSVLFDPDDREGKLTEKRLGEAWKALGIKADMPNGRETREAVEEMTRSTPEPEKPAPTAKASCNTASAALGGRRAAAKAH
jgi:hypothetical protein